MSAHSIPRLLTVEEYERIPDPPGGRYELRHGEAVFVAYPVREHKAIQRNARDLLLPLVKPHGFIVDTEYPYRPLPENEVWGADVACVKASRDRLAKWLEGSPELVIEVRSPSNTKAELHDRAMTTIAGVGCVAFWLADFRTRSVTVYSPAKGMCIYQGDAEVPVGIVPGAIRLNDLFADIES